MAKYSDSFYHEETCDAATTTYSKWFDVAFANELYAYVESVETSSGTYSIVVTVERCLPYITPTGSTVLTFTTITGDTTEEKRANAPATDGAAPGAENIIGLRVRFKYVNTWTSGSTAVHSKIYAKRI